jgi:hypothetical protein
MLSQFITIAAALAFVVGSITVAHAGPEGWVNGVSLNGGGNNGIIKNGGNTNGVAPGMTQFAIDGIELPAAR